MQKAHDALAKLNSSYEGMPKASPRRKNRKPSDRHAKNLAYLAPFLSAPLFLLFAVTITAVFLSGNAVVGYISLFAFAIFLYVFYSFYRAALEKLERNRLRAGGFLRVTREGEKLLLPAEDLVVGDILTLCAGDILYADCRVLSSLGLTVTEYRDGRCEILEKNAEVCETSYETASNMLFTGSEVLSGEATVAVVTVGDGRIFVGAPEKDCRFQTPFAKTLAKLTELSSYALLGIVFVAAVFGLTPLSARGILDDWLFAIAFAASSSLELLSVILTISLTSSLSKEKTLTVKDKGSLEAFTEASDAILSAEPLWEILSPSLSALLLPTDSSVRLEELTKALSAEGVRLLKNSSLVLSSFDSLPPFFEKRLQKPLSAYLDAQGLSYRDGAEELLSFEIPALALCRVFLRGERLVVSLVGDSRYILSQSGYYYCGNDIKPLSDRDSTRFLQSGALGVAIGVLPKDTELTSDVITSLMAGKLVFEGAMVLSYNENALSLWRESFEKASLSLTVYTADLSEYAFFKPYAEKYGFSLTRLSDSAAITSLLPKEKRHPRLVEIRSRRDAEALAEGDFSVYRGECPEREAMTLDQNPRLADLNAAREAADILYNGEFSSLARLKYALLDRYDRVMSATAYLFFALALKLFPTLFTIFLGKNLVSALFFVLMGFGFDTLAVFSILFRPARETLAGYSKRSLYEGVIASLATGTLSGVVAIVFSLIASGSFSLSAEVFSTVSILSLSLFAFCLRYFRRDIPFAPSASLGTGLVVGGMLTLFVLILVRGSFGKFGLLFLSLAIVLYLLFEVGAAFILKKIASKGEKKVKNWAKKVKKGLDKS